MQLAVQIEELTLNLPNLPSWRLGFATNLVNTFTRKGTLSPGQTPWVSRLVRIAKGEDAQPQPVTVGDLSGLLNLFTTASAKLKWPKIRLQVNDTAVVLSVAGPASRAPGSINIAGEGGYGNRAWFGRVSPDGRFDPSRSLEPEFASALIPVLNELATDPIAAVKRYGSMTGCCMFCGDPLGPRNGKPETPTTRRSVAAGFGETCAKNYGLHAEWKQAAK